MLRTNLLFLPLVFVSLVACGGAEEPSAEAQGAGGGTTSQGPSTSAAGGGGVGGQGVGGAGGSQAPEGVVPIALALGNGRIATSCDRGASYAQDWIIASDASDHHPYAMAAGAAFHEGVFVVGTGWGYPGHVLRSDNGIDWEDLPAERFHWADQTTHMPEGAVAVMFHNGTRFVLITGRRRLFSMDGRDWFEEGEQLPNEMFHLRSHRFVEELGVHFLRGENSNKQVQWLATSTDGGLTYQMLPGGSGFDFACNARMEYAHGTLMAPGGDGYCRSTDGGATWSYHAAPMRVSTFYPTDAGWVTMGGHRSAMLESSDGLSWQESTVANGMRFSAGGYSAYLDYYVAASHQNEEFYRSDDGVTWTALPEAAASEVPDIRHVVFGWGKPSALCPLPAD